MKKCPYCNEEIQKIAKKCRFCGEWIENNASNNSINLETNTQTFISFIQRLFNGRLDRRNFTKGFFLFIFLLFIPPVIELLLYETNKEANTFYIFTTFFWSLPLVLLLVAIHIRRLHDTNRKGTKLYWGLLTFVIPLLLIWNLGTIFQKGNNNTNNYGDKPSEKRKFWSAVLNLG